MTTSPSKRIGTRAENEVARLLGGTRAVAMQYGPIDVEAGHLRLQVKCTSTLPSLNYMRAKLALIPYGEDTLRGVVVIDRPGSGIKVRRTIMFDLDEYAEWYVSPRVTVFDERDTT